MPKKPKIRMGVVERRFLELRAAGEAHGYAIYEVLFRNAGVGIFWYDEKRVPSHSQWLSKAGELRDRWKAGLFVEKYYPTITQAIEGEIKRLKDLLKEKKNVARSISQRT